MNGLSLTDTVLPFLTGYLSGSIPFGLLIARAAGAGDVRKIGSGNIGATNVLRTGHKGLAALTLIADFLKGYLIVLYFLTWGEIPAVFAGFGAFVGHLYPVWLKFKGGKGVAVYLGILAAFSWKGFLLFAIVWLITAWQFRYSSLAGLAATLAVPVYFLTLGQVAQPVAVLFFIMAGMIWFKHRENISRLLSGTENRIGGRGNE